MDSWCDNVVFHLFLLSRQVAPTRWGCPPTLCSWVAEVKQTKATFTPSWSCFWIRTRFGVLTIPQVSYQKASDLTAFNEEKRGKVSM